jgi:hypothetical protein
MKRPVPEKNKPDFSNLDDKHIADGVSLLEDLRKAFEHDKEVSSALSVAWKALTDEQVERIEVDNIPDKPVKPLKPKGGLLKKRKLVKSPMKRC